MPGVELRENESLESLLRRFKRRLQMHRVLEEARRHERYEKPSEKRRRELASAIRRRNRTARRSNQF
ncbi:MAG: 30S ribosomal protein S21 [Armatimonadetes bacterium]|nr:30S ribosomal protein S21 [Armatimonadota bacterium]NIM23404.1 30S ribosomal protein S21 [Armatimonadota bacterium]NIM67269.1 30S ribosomal protein S21 [Armatimonadota bacterium]NIM75767.1 30S ribosomal protein S21 [Armatimonadota bacterium]NIN05455.1 30S ribosomal protein S21 [Armatimonadota bacterium]